jgi:hypothetical protein
MNHLKREENNKDPVLRLKLSADPRQKSQRLGEQLPGK